VISLYAGVAAGGLIVTGIIGSYFYGVNVGSELEAGKAARDREVVEIAMNSANAAVAANLANLTVKNTTIRQTLESKTREVPYPVDCRLQPDVLRLLNSTPGIAPAASAAGGGELPASGSTR
jgi:ABC-type uncharacterized transport system YnjBCD substrate-binding protein